MGSHWKPKPTKPYKLGISVFTAENDLVNLTLTSDDGLRVYHGVRDGDHHYTIDISDAKHGQGSNLIATCNGYYDKHVRILLDPPSRELDPIALEQLPILDMLGTYKQFLRPSDGKPFTVKSQTQFNAFNLFLRGKRQHTIDLLDQSAELGFNFWRVWTLFDLEQYGIGKLTLNEFPDLYFQIPNFLRLCAQYGHYINFTAYTGVNDPDHWFNLCNAVLPEKNRIVSLVNELSENTNEPDYLGRIFNLGDYKKFDGILCDHGSNGSEHLPVGFISNPDDINAPPINVNGWDWASFHTNDAFEEQRKVGHNAMEIWNHPTITEETSRTDKKDWSALMEATAEGAALLCAGMNLHTVSGKKSDLLNDDEVRIAKLMIRGMNKVDLTYQDGQYIHRSDLEKEQDLRAYERRLDGDDGYIVYIPKTIRG